MFTLRILICLWSINKVLLTQQQQQQHHQQQQQLQQQQQQQQHQERQGHQELKDQNMQKTRTCMTMVNEGISETHQLTICTTNTSSITLKNLMKCNMFSRYSNRFGPAHGASPDQTAAMAMAALSIKPIGDSKLEATCFGGPKCRSSKSRRESWRVKLYTNVVWNHHKH